MSNNSRNQDQVPVVTLIPAAGIGLRMKAACPKQYITVAGKTIMEHTLSALLQQPRISKIIVSLHKDDKWFHQLSLANYPIIQTVIGGCQRADSVLAGINYLSDTLSSLDHYWVLVHDAARPCLHQADLDKIISFIDSKPSSYGGILAVPVRDTIKSSMQGKISHTVERSKLWHALTPQFFPLALIKNCLSQALAHKVLITDDASALEYCGYHPQLLEGRVDNLKITQPEDLMFAELYLSRI